MDNIIENFKYGFKLKYELQSKKVFDNTKNSKGV